MKSMVLGHHPTDEPIQDISLLINLIELKDATSTQVAQLLGVSPFLLSRFLRNLSYGHYTDKLKGSQRLIAFTVEGAQQIIDMRDRHNAQKNKEPVEIRKKINQSKIYHTLNLGNE